MKNRITHVIKRTGRMVLFNEAKVVQVIWKAMDAEGEGTREDAEEVAELVIQKLNKDFPEKAPTVEDVQDRVEQALMESGHTAVAKGYILYRNERAKLREQKSALIGGRIDELDLDLNSVRILEKRYLLRDEDGQIAETPAELFWRVANHVALAEIKHGEEPKEWARQFHRMLANLEFLPGSPVLMNAGTKGYLASSTVIPVEDSVEGVYQAMMDAALIQKSGGGTGFSFSRLRPRGDLAAGTPGLSPGPCAFLSLFEPALAPIRQAGRRQGANMAVLRVDHPDILSYINLKVDGRLKNFNLSVGITDTFLDALAHDAEYDIIHPKTGKPTGKLSARVVFDAITGMTWRRGDPGVLFLDRIEADNPCPHLGRIEATGPCAEQPLLPHECAIEGSINLTTCARAGKIDHDKLRRLTRLAVRFLDDAHDVNVAPVAAVERMSRRTRRIGLGVMGFADLLYALGVPYDTDEAVSIADEIGKIMREEAEAVSRELAAERGAFTAWRGSRLEKQGIKRRNSGLLGIAPTGTISLIAGVSGGIEPNYALTYTRTTAEGSELAVANPLFLEKAQAAEVDEETIRRITKRGRIAADDAVGADIRTVFKTAQEIDPEWHLRIQAAFQKHVDGAISKTISYPSTASVLDIERGILRAWELGCKGVTAYRDTSMDAQVLVAGGPQ